ncbi:hypothetical protein ACFL59_14885, partial [Planctomycetota bacterium]
RENVQVHDFAYLESGILLVSTSRGLFALGSSPESERCPPGYVLHYEEPAREVVGGVVAVAAYRSGLSVYSVKAQDGSELVVQTTVDGLRFWMRESWLGGCWVKVRFKRLRLDGRTGNWIQQVTPIRSPGD